MTAEQAIPAFRERRWDEVRQRCLRSRGSLGHFFTAWATFELGEPVDTAALRLAIADSRAWALHDTWGLWPFRRRVTVDRLVEWGVWELLLSSCWSAFADAIHSRATFVTDWVGPELLEFNCGLDPDATLAVPWQLGSAKPVLDRHAERRVRAWAVNQLATATLSPDAREAVSLLDRPEALRRVRHTGEVVYEALSALSRRESLPIVLGLLGQTLRSEPRIDQTARAASLDQLLLVADLESRLREQERTADVDRVLFRRTPRRALEVVVARLTSGRYGTLARYLERGLPGEVWTEGSLDEALAAVPEQHFAHAVTTLAPSR